MSDLKGEEKPDGASFDDFFESLGKKAEHLTLKDSALKSKDSGATPVGEELTTEAAATTDDSDDQKVVDEIESLCMNCHENVSC
jgi:zinc finger protein